MTESYELQVLFTEEERNTYADWGIKKEKVLMPFAIATVLIYVVTAAFVVMKVWGVRDSDHVLFQMLVLGDWIPELTGVLAVLMTILLLADEINRTASKTQAALLEVMERHPEVYLKLVGVLDESGMEPVQNRIEKLPFMDWRQLPGVIAGLDINLMPLENTLFHCCKSENKWTEAALVIVPSVMSRNREMEYVIEYGKDGWMCTTKEEWVSALESLITDEKAR